MKLPLECANLSNTTTMRILESVERWNESPGFNCASLGDTALPRAQVRSWHLASGLFWIMNVLIELDVYAFCPPCGHWADVSSGRVLRDSHFKRHHMAPFPRVADLIEAEALISMDLVVDCSHALPRPGSGPTPTILWYRNLFGAMYSDFARFGAGTSFRSWFTAPHFYGLPISKQDGWALYYALWINLSGGNVISASFDYCKRNPVKGIARVLDGLGVTRSEEAIESACRRSDPGYIGAQGNANLDRYKFRTGSASEYTTALTDSDVTLVRGIPTIVMDHLTGRRSKQLTDLNTTYLIELTEVFSGKRLPLEVTHALESDDLIGLSHYCSKDYPHDAACNVVSLALRISAMLGGNSVLDAQEMYPSSDAPIVFKTSLFCLTQASIPELVRKFAQRESKRPILLHERLYYSEHNNSD